MPKIGRLDVQKHRKWIPPAYHTPKNRAPGVRTPNSKILTEALHQAYHNITARQVCIPLVSRAQNSNHLGTVILVVVSNFN